MNSGDDMSVSFPELLFYGKLLRGNIFAIVGENTEPF